MRYVFPECGLGIVILDLVQARVHQETMPAIPGSQRKYVWRLFIAQPKYQHELVLQLHLRGKGLTTDICVGNLYLSVYPVLFGENL